MNNPYKDTHFEPWYYIATNCTVDQYNLFPTNNYIYARIAFREIDLWKDRELYRLLTDILSVKALTKLLPYINK